MSWDGLSASEFSAPRDRVLHDSKHIQIQMHIAFTFQICCQIQIPDFRFQIKFVFRFGFRFADACIVGGHLESHLVASLIVLRPAGLLHPSCHLGGDLQTRD